MQLAVGCNQGVLNDRIGAVNILVRAANFLTAWQSHRSLFLAHANANAWLHIDHSSHLHWYQPLHESTKSMLNAPAAALHIIACIASAVSLCLADAEVLHCVLNRRHVCPAVLCYGSARPCHGTSYAMLCLAMLGYAMSSYAMPCYARLC